MPKNRTGRHITVIGAGIIGIACASYLVREGLRVTVVDRDLPGEGCSQGSGGLLAPGSCIPLAMPGVLGQVPKWMLDPDAPLALSWSYAPRAFPWLLRFVAESSQTRARRNAAAQRAITVDTFANYDPLLKAAGAEQLVRRTGYLYLYETEASFAKSQAMWDLRKSMGVPTELLCAHQLRQMEPALAPGFERAVYLPDEGYCTNPLDLTRALAAQFVRDGGEILRKTALAFDFNEDGPCALRTDAGTMDLDYLLVAAGAFSGAFARDLGNPIPLESLRGYNITIAHPGQRPRIPLMVADRKFGMTPMEPDLLRVSGIAEIAGLSALPSPRRKAYFLQEAKRLLGDIDTREVTDWLGHRPSLPDSVPVISASSIFPSVYYAFGHGIAGLTGASTTGKLIADLVTGRRPGIDMTPYRIDRFRTWPRLSQVSANGLMTRDSLSYSIPQIVGKPRKKQDAAQQLPDRSC